MENNNDFYMLRELEVKYNVKDRSKFNVNSSTKAFEYFKQLYNKESEIDFREIMYAIFLNKRNNVVGWYKLSIGGVSGTICDAKILFGTALKCLASGIILCHNHPSGNLKPSNSDIKMTKVMSEFGNKIDIVLLDHIIIASDETDYNYKSMADEGLM